MRVVSLLSMSARFEHVWRHNSLYCVLGLSMWFGITKQVQRMEQGGLCEFIVLIVHSMMRLPC